MIPPGATVGRKHNAIDGTLITKGVVFLLASVPQQQKGRDATEARAAGLWERKGRWNLLRVGFLSRILYLYSQILTGQLATEH